MVEVIEKIRRLREEAAKIETDKASVSTHWQSQEFDHDGINFCYVLSINHKSGYAELLQPSRCIVKTVLPIKAAEQINHGDLLAIKVETGMSSSGNLEVNIKNIKRVGGTQNEHTKKVC